MTEKQWDINRLNNRIQSLQSEINELSYDFRFVKGKKSLELLGDEIKRLEKFKEHKEFELWKLEREVI